jgi:hypothetical protein
MPSLLFRNPDYAMPKVGMLPQAAVNCGVSATTFRGTARIENNGLHSRFQYYVNVCIASHHNYTALNTIGRNVETKGPSPRLGARLTYRLCLSPIRNDGISTSPSFTSTRNSPHRQARLIAPAFDLSSRRVKQNVSKSPSTPRQWAGKQRGDGAVVSHMPGHPQVQREVRPTGIPICADQDPGRQDHPRWQ